LSTKGLQDFKRKLELVLLYGPLMFNERSEKLKFSYRGCDRRLMEAELRIKERIRKNALNVSVESDIERYTDRYLESRLSSVDAVRSVLDLELMSPELIRMFGEEGAVSVEDMKEVESNVESSRDGSDGGGDMSEEIDNDYVINFTEDDEDELTNEANEGAFLY
jgi:hypothetical protein